MLLLVVIVSVHDIGLAGSVGTQVLADQQSVARGGKIYQKSRVLTE
ncbi:MAG: hypothetical protein ACOCTP_02305 [Roseicyclus sp.]